LALALESFRRQLSAKEVVAMIVRTSHALPVVFVLTFCTVLTGCVAIPGKNGTTHHLIIGIGLVSVNDSCAQAVVATDAHALGISISNQPGLKFAAGYSSNTVVSVAEGADDVRVEISKLPGRPLMIDVPAARLKSSNPSRGEPRNGEND
jgi:hypothetical protein